MSTFEKTSEKALRLNPPPPPPPATFGVTAIHRVHSTGPRVRNVATARTTTRAIVLGPGRTRRRRAGTVAARSGVCGTVVVVVTAGASLVEDEAAAETELEGGDA